MPEDFANIKNVPEDLVDDNGYPLQPPRQVESNIRPGIRREAPVVANKMDRIETVSIETILSLINSTVDENLTPMEEAKRLKVADILSRLI